MLSPPYKYLSVKSEGAFESTKYLEWVAIRKILSKCDEDFNADKHEHKTK